MASQRIIKNTKLSDGSYVRTSLTPLEWIVSKLFGSVFTILKVWFIILPYYWAIKLPYWLIKKMLKLSLPTLNKLYVWLSLVQLAIFIIALIS